MGQVPSTSRTLNPKPYTLPPSGNILLPVGSRSRFFGAVRLGFRGGSEWGLGFGVWGLGLRGLKGLKGLVRFDQNGPFSGGRRPASPILLPEGRASKVCALTGSPDYSMGLNN